MRGLAVTSKGRWPAIPNVPTMAEAGLSDFVVTSWGAMVMPARTPPDITRRLSTAVREIMADPGFAARYLAVGARAVSTSPEELAAYMARERAMWGEVVKTSGTKFQ